MLGIVFHQHHAEADPTVEKRIGEESKKQAYPNFLQVKCDKSLSPVKLKLLSGIQSIIRDLLHVSSLFSLFYFFPCCCPLEEKGRGKQH